MDNRNKSRVALEVRDLKVYFHMLEGTLRVVDGFNFNIEKNTILGLVGETGCGKSVTAQAIMRIVPPPRSIEGSILYHRENGSGKEVVDLIELDPEGERMRRMRCREIGMIVQEPKLAFSPLHTIGNQITEAINLHLGVEGEMARDMAIKMLDRVGFPEASTRVDYYPWQLSGGLCQRAMIAMALVCHPSILIADEPTTALDVTIQAQILELIKELQAEFGMSVLFISHDLAVIAEITEKVVIMYLGEDIEIGTTDDIFNDPRHPYTINLLRSIPRIGRRERLSVIKGIPPLPFSLPPGCRFYPRCPEFKAGICDRESPPLIEVSEGHRVRCFKNYE